jgi:hypothetical protein
MHARWQLECNKVNQVRLESYLTIGEHWCFTGGMSLVTIVIISLHMDSHNPRQIGAWS